MKRRRLLLTLIALACSCFLCCSAAFASQAIVDSYTDDYVHPSQFDNCLILDGIDVSYWQADVEWDKVKRQGIDYAFIRIGYTGTDSPFSMNQDSYFEQNYQLAKDNGVMVGVYYYSCATSIAEAKKEAQYVLDILDDRELDLPVVFDFEYAGRIKDKFKTKAATTSNILAFLNYIDNNSEYQPMFYSYRNIMDPTWSPKFNMNMIDEKFPVWVAQYSTDISYSRPFTFWQYANDGEVRGVEGQVDCNFWYYDNEAEETLEDTISIKDATVKLSKTSYEFSKFQFKPTVTVKYEGEKLVRDVDYKLYYLKNVNAGTAYAMIRGIGCYSNTQLVPFEITTTDIANEGTVEPIAPQRYTGEPVTVDLNVSYSGTDLKKGVDYTVSYADNNQVGMATVTIKGKRNYHGSFTTTFDIVKMQAQPEFTGETEIVKEMSSPAFKLNLQTTSDGAKTYTTSDSTIATVAEDGTVTLSGQPGVVTVTLETAATPLYYGGSKSVNITVTKASNAITGIEPAYTVLTDTQPFILGASHTGTAPLTYTSSNPAVAITDANGQITVTGPGQTEITITAAEDEQYMGASATIILTVNRTEAEIIDCIQNSTIKATSKASYGKMTINWEYAGKESVDYFEIFKSTKKNNFGTKRLAKKDGSLASHENKTSLSKGKRYYFKVRGVKTIGGKKYYTQWSNVTYKLYKYTGTGDIKKINGIKATTVNATSTRGTGYIKVNWKKTGNYKVDYYQIRRSTTKTFKSGTVATYKTSKGTRLYYKNTTKLAKGKRYYYKVRGVRVIDGKKYYTKWSNVVTRIAK